MLRCFVSVLLSWAIAFSAPPAFGDVVVRGQLKKAQLEKLSSSPAGAEARIYYDTTEKKAKIHNGTAWTSVGSGSGSGGINNFVTGGDAEDTIANPWATYADAAAASPVDGTGGSPSVSVTRVTTASALINGSAVWALAKGATNRQGDGWAIDFALPAKAPLYGTQASLTFDYYFSAATVGEDAVRVYLYDKDTSTLITPKFYSCTTTAPALKTQSTPCAAKIEWTAHATSDDYRLVFHVATSSATSFTAYVDNIYVGVGQQVVGGYVGEWQPHVPASYGSSPTVTASEIFYRRVGNNLEMKGGLTFGAAGSSASFTVPLPSGLTINTALHQSVNSTRSTSLNGSFYSGSAILPVFPYPKSSTALGFMKNNSSLADVLGTDIASGNVVTFSASFPITEWAGTGTTTVSTVAKSPVRAGTVMAYAGSTAPAGWQLCDGTALSQTSYPELYAAIGTTYNTQTNPTTGSAYSAPSAGTFRVPDYRGVFLRGVGTANTTVATTLGGWQDDATAKNGLANQQSTATGSVSGTTDGGGSHSHGTAPGGTRFITNNNVSGAVGGYASGANQFGTSTLTDTASNHTHPFSASLSSGVAAAQTITGDTETRPVNVGVNYIIKLYNDTVDLTGLAAATETATGLVSKEGKGTFTPSFTGARATSPTFSYYVTGKTVTLMWGDNVGSSCANNYFEALAAVPAAIRPASAFNATIAVQNSGAAQDFPGLITIETSGRLLILRSISTTQFTASANCGYYAGVVTYGIN